VEPFVQQEDNIQNQNNALDDLINAMDIEADFPIPNQANNAVQANESHSSITLTVSLSKGVNSVNNPAAFIPDQEVNQLQIVPVLEHPPQDAPSPVIVNGNE
jgi:hypothetical protein